MNEDCNGRCAQGHGLPQAFVARGSVVCLDRFMSVLKRPSGRVALGIYT